MNNATENVNVPVALLLLAINALRERALQWLDTHRPNVCTKYYEVK